VHWCGAMSLLHKPLYYKGVHLIFFYVGIGRVFPAPAFWFTRYLIVVHRPMSAAPRVYLIVVSTPMPAAARRYLIVVPRPLHAAPLVVHRRCLVVAPGRCPGRG
jgi:hypothetical protein